MDVSTIKNNKTLKEILERVQNECTSNKKLYSDIVDDEGLQYVDLVMEGGGMLGIALVGYTYVLEQAGIRFLGIGGTSAGSINALLLAALGAPNEKKGDKLIKELFSKNFFDFVDGDDDAVDFIECYLSGAKKLKLAFKGAQIIDNLRDDLGLNPGDHFTHWLDGILEKEGIHTLEDLQKRIETIPKGLRVREKEFITTVKKAGCKLAIIAADISTETKVEFPKMAGLYWSNPKEVKPSLFARASMSIPYFFHPFEVDNLPQNEEQIAKWKEYAGFLVDEEGESQKTHYL
jgi:NTE family protein